MSACTDKSGGKENLTQLLLFNEHEPHSTLYHFRGKTITREEMKQAVASLASQFYQILQPGDSIVICLNDSPSLASAFLAAMAMGAIPTVINPKCRTANLLGITKHCGARVLIVEPERIPDLPPMTDTLVIDRPDERLFSDFTLNDKVGYGEPTWNDFHRKRCHETSYLQYTSGSTAAPKAVIHTINTTLGFSKAYAEGHLALSPADLCYSIPKIFFGYGMGNSLFFPLLTGSAAILDDRWPNPSHIIDNISRYSPNVLFAVPAVYHMLREHAELVASLTRLAVSAGAPLPRDEFEFWKNKGIEVRDGIGATEVGHIFLSNHAGQAKAGRTGRPLPEYQCKLIDAQGRLIKQANTRGVLLVKGPGVSPGYLKMPEKNSKVFTSGWYRTGDLFHFDDDGYYRYLGREDDLFKVNGRKVVPAVVEQKLSGAFDEVIECALTPSTRERDNVKPTLFLVLRAGSDVNRQVYADWLRAEFDSHMQPRTIVSLSALPRNDNGKVIRSELIDQASNLLMLDMESQALCE